MACTTAFLLEHDRDVLRLAHEYDLSVGQHPTLPLVVLNYRRGMTRSDPEQKQEQGQIQIQNRRVVQADHPIVAECRGLVIEVDDTARFVRVVAQGFARFWHISSTSIEEDEPETPATLLALSAANSGFDLAHPYQVQAKEDGSFMLVYCFRDHIVCSSRNNFGQEMLQLRDGRRVSKSDLLFETMGVGKKGVLVPTNVTWCVEFCSEYNRVVRLYAEPTVFLVGLLQRKDNTDDAPFVEVRDVNRLASLVADLRASHGVQLHRPWIAPEPCVGVAQVLRLLDVRLAQDPTHEGFVLVDAAGRRLKIKSELYALAHRLKYLGFVTCTPSLCVPLLLDPDPSPEQDYASRMDWLLAHLDLTPSQQRLIDTRVDAYRASIKHTLERVRGLWALVCDMAALDKTVTREQLAKAVAKVAVGEEEDSALRPMLYALTANLGAPIDETLARQFIPLLIKRCLEGASANIDIDNDQQSIKAHSSKTMFGYCDIQEATQQRPPTREFNDGVALHPPVNNGHNNNNNNEWSVTCFCGHPMRLHTLKHFMHVPRTCHCGVERPASIGTVVKTYIPRSVIWVCTNEPHCLLTMEAHQRTIERNGKPVVRGDPLGVPASAVCKNLRLVAHDLLGRLADARGWDMDVRYNWLAQSMRLEPEDAHMSRMSITPCRTAIALMQQALQS